MVNSTVLYIDDEITNITLFEGMFGRDFRVITAFSVAQGLEIMQTHQVAVAITDLWMPQSSGFEFIKQAKQLFPDTVYMILTAWADYEATMQALNISAVHRFLLKPLSYEMIKDVISQAIDINKIKQENKQLLADLQLKNKELLRLKERLEDENHYLQQEIKGYTSLDNFVCKDKKFIKILQSVEAVAASDASVLITGETGTGKELIARAVHTLSLRNKRPLIKINCAAIPETLIESELFGHEKGAFTGALYTKKGKFELANGGTIFLDEIGEMPKDLQVKLLRVLQEGEIERVGGSATISVNVRVIAATNRDLHDEVKNERFRSDLFYRLNVFPVHIPPLRERKDDIEPMANFFVDRYNVKNSKHIAHISRKVLDQLQAYHWPGNVRELENIIERAVILSNGHRLEIEHLLHSLPHTSNEHNRITENQHTFLSLDEMERQHILQAIQRCNGKIGGINGAAEILKINRTTLLSRMEKLGIERKID